ncbi:MAG: MFS transporter [Syntrophomonadaceae bacterium]|nr:MFS transporter [Syntrophomonadaceae bacterium]
MKEVLNRRTVTVAVCIFLAGMGFSIIMPILPYYADAFDASAFQVGLLMAVYALCQLIFSPWWGALSDRVGRKPIIILGLLGYAITFIWFAFADSLVMLFIARALGGVLACAALPTAMASMADLSSEEDRGRAMGLAGASIGMGMIFGPALGGLLSSVSLGFPFLVAGLLALANAIAVIFFLEEPLPAERRSPKLKKQQTLFLRGLRTPIALFLVVMFLASTSETTHQGVFALYAKGLLDIDSVRIGWAFTVAGLVSALAQMMLIGPLLARWREEKVIGVGLAFIVLAFLLYTHATGFLQLIIFMGIYALGIALVRPSLNAAASRRTTMEQGQTMGTLQSFESLGRVIGPCVGGILLDVALPLPYYWAAAVAAIALLALCIKGDLRAVTAEEGAQR